MASSIKPPTVLRRWLIKQHDLFMEDLSRADLADWVICVGNESGDLDTLASSIAFAYLSSFYSSPQSIQSSSNLSFIPVQLTSSTDFDLRPENMEALTSADLIDENLFLPMKELVCRDRVDFSKFGPCGAKFALLDHNQLKASIFGNQAQVIAVIDHHEPEMDNTLYLSASPRIIQVPTGSCASLVTNYFAARWPQEAFPTVLADFLLSAISIDTSNFKPISTGGKATEADNLAKQWLLARSRFYLSTIPEDPFDLQSESRSADLDSQLKQFHKHLSNLKNDVSKLNSSQLLLRDYKQYDTLGWALGLSTVPLELEHWVEERSDSNWTELLVSLKEHAISKGLALAGILTHYKSKNSNRLDPGQQKHGRQLILLVTDKKLGTIFERLEDFDKTATAETSLKLSPLVIKDQLFVENWVAPILVRLMESFGPKL
ncbi:hypothetical protein O181_012642 [Austropuccinia psidii MF-1]|uniref:DHHA2 domain-containing protein n=1 Tax=Austropuccinia psidii MF-1 TaxID=1389203 RepID=A0A9Q3BWT8_9BASI|nr:hypothetical protein [Austropuccinia psidii MF-1]